MQDNSAYNLWNNRVQSSCIDLNTSDLQRVFIHTIFLNKYKNWKNLENTIMQDRKKFKSLEQMLQK